MTKQKKVTQIFLGFVIYATQTIKVPYCSVNRTSLMTNENNEVF